VEGLQEELGDSDRDNCKGTGLAQQGRSISVLFILCYFLSAQYLFKECLFIIKERKRGRKDGGQCFVEFTIQYSWRGKKR
jgi:hypothetical protein